MFHTVITEDVVDERFVLAIRIAMREAQSEVTGSVDFEDTVVTKPVVVRGEEVGTAFWGIKFDPYRVEFGFSVDGEDARWVEGLYGAGCVRVCLI